MQDKTEEKSLYVCPICGNSDKRYIGYINSKPYCRKCISFKGREADNSYKIPSKAGYKLDYELSNDQLKLSEKLILNYKKGINTLVHAVCGSGKTEIVLEVIKYSIECGDKVGFAVPRRDVANELYERFKVIFKRNKIALVHGGHTDELNGDLVCLTTHQLYRYKEYFDLLILDEVDAFPFKNNEVLNQFFYLSVKGKYIMMSATPDETLLNKFKGKGFDVVQLFSRFHKHPLPVPKLIEAKSILIYGQLIKVLKYFLKKKKQVFVFCPTIQCCRITYFFLKIFFKNGNYVHSKRVQRTDIISKFKNKEFDYLVTTAVLERGVTVKDLQVIVFNADHKIYDRYSLVQIAGRVGRKKDAPGGEVIFIGKKISKSMLLAREDILDANKSVQALL